MKQNAPLTIYMLHMMTEPLSASWAYKFWKWLTSSACNVLEVLQFSNYALIAKM